MFGGDGSGGLSPNPIPVICRLRRASTANERMPTSPCMAGANGLDEVCVGGDGRAHVPFHIRSVSDGNMRRSCVAGAGLPSAATRFAVSDNPKCSRTVAQRRRAGRWPAGTISAPRPTGPTAPPEASGEALIWRRGRCSYPRADRSDPTSTVILTHPDAHGVRDVTDSRSAFLPTSPREAVDRCVGRSRRLRECRAKRAAAPVGEHHHEATRHSHDGQRRLQTQRERERRGR